jgi:dTDP-4-amino-4,6-dideoxygalactose transaminase
MLQEGPAVRAVFPGRAAVPPVLIGPAPLAEAVRVALEGRGVHPVVPIPPAGDDRPDAEPVRHTAAGWTLHLDPGPAAEPPGDVEHLRALELRPGAPLVLTVGLLGGRPIRGWEAALGSTLPLIRLLPALTGRTVVALSDVRAATVLPLSDAEILARCDEVAAAPGIEADPDPTRAAGRARRLVRGVAPGDLRALISRAGELLLERVVPAGRLARLRVDELVDDPAGSLAHLRRRLAAGLEPHGSASPVGSASPAATVSLVTAADLGEVVAALLTGHLPVPTDPVTAATLTLERAHLITLLDPTHQPDPTPTPVLIPDPTPDLIPDPGQAFDPGPASGPRRFRRLLEAARGPKTSDELEATAEQVYRARLRRQIPAAEPDALSPPVPVVIPPRPEHPDEVAGRMAAALSSGLLKHGGPWTTRLTDTLGSALDLPAGRSLLLTASGSAALRLAVVALAGHGRPARPGQVAVLPSYTFAATGEILSQLGYRLRFYDIDPHTWTGDPVSARRALAAGDAALLLTVDALGNPVDYPALRALAREFAVPLIADSAPALGARSAGVPVGSQADAHVFSMSFAKVVSAGGAGGALVLPTSALPSLGASGEGPVDWTRSATMPELAAIAALDQVVHLEELHERRARVAAVYAEVLTGLEGIVSQRVRPGDRHALVHWAARFADPTAGPRLAERGIGTRNYYGPVLHHQAWPGDEEGDRAALPETDRLAGQVLALPMSSELHPVVAEQVADRVRRLLSRSGRWDRPGR